jgi:hypothetical protein
MKAVRLDSQERGFPLVTDGSDRATPDSLCRDIILASDQHDAPKLESALRAEKERSLRDPQVHAGSAESFKQD